MSENQLDLGPGLRLPIITTWRAYPGYRLNYYRDAKINTEQIKIYDTLQCTNGYFFLLPANFEELLDADQQGIAMLCRTNNNTKIKDETGKERPCANISGVQHVQIKAFMDQSPLGGEWVKEIEITIPDDVKERITQLKSILRRVDPKILSVSNRKRLETKIKPVDFCYGLANTLDYSLPNNVRAQTIQITDIGDLLELFQKWLETQISQDQKALLGLRLDRLAIPPDVRTKLDTEFSLLQSSPSNSSEHERLMTYLQFAASLPWGDPITPPGHTLAEARILLDKEHAGLDKAKKFVIDQLATLLWWKQLSNQVRKEAQPAQPPLRNMLLVGPPGTGKTTFLNALATALDRQIEIIPCGGISDVVALGGLERGYIGARVGAILESIMRTKTLNLVLGLDEIDKMGSTHRGDPYAILLELTDPVRNTQFTDRYFQFPFDLSQVLVVATANTLDPIPDALLDRFDIIELRGYSMREKLHMARFYALPRLYSVLTLSEEQVSITDAALACIIEEYTYESGIRGLTRTLLTLLQRVLADLLTDPSHKLISPTEVRQYLGTPVILHNRTPLKSGPGYSTILAISTAIGTGKVNGMQISLLKAGSGKLHFSGFDGDVAKESAQTALSYLKLHTEDMNIDPSILSSHDIHIHGDEIAIRKMGPSASVAILLALLSSIRGVALPEKWAVTGEITLDGRVLVVGGVAEKLVAAHRAGITTVLIPNGNQANLTDIPEDILAEVTVIPVATIAEAITHAFPARPVVKRKRSARRQPIEREKDSVLK